MKSNHNVIRTRILLIEDNAEDRRSIIKAFERKFDIECAIHYEDAMTKIKELQFDLVLLDLMLPEKQGGEIVESGKLGLKLLNHIHKIEPLCPVVVISGMCDVSTALDILECGVVDFIVKGKIEAQVPVIVKKAELVRKGRVESLLLRRIEHLQSDYSFIYASPKMAIVDEQITKYAAVDASVLLLGESGTGKDVIAREIHRRSPRANDPFIAINCGAFTESLVESELFGCEKGAFTGADRTKPGLFEAANNGTLFLDEVADLTPGLQVKLLRVLEDGSFRRVGSTKLLTSNFRIISATNKDIQQERDKNRFREDLLFRLNKINLTVPPLRDRPEDIEVLAKHFLTDLSTKRAFVLLDDAVDELTSYSWRGNVRELYNAILQLTVISDRDEINGDAVKVVLPANGAVRNGGLPTLNLAEYEKMAIREALKYNRPQGEAAKLLGISLSSLRRKLTTT